MTSRMNGWEAFDSVSADRDGDVTIRPLGGTEGWPDDEITNGVVIVEVQTHGDAPNGSFVRVVGPDRDAVAACFLRCREAVLDGTFASLLKGAA